MAANPPSKSMTIPISGTTTASSNDTANQIMVEKTRRFNSSRAMSSAGNRRIWTHTLSNADLVKNETICFDQYYMRQNLYLNIYTQIPTTCKAQGPQLYQIPLNRIKKIAIIPTGLDLYQGLQLICMSRDSNILEILKVNFQPITALRLMMHFKTQGRLQYFRGLCLWSNLFISPHIMI